MDPIENLKEQRACAARLLARIENEDFDQGFREDADRLADLFQAMDSWRLMGGFDPYVASP